MIPAHRQAVTAWTFPIEFIMDIRKWTQNLEKQQPSSYWKNHDLKCQNACIYTRCIIIPDHGLQNENATVNCDLLAPRTWESETLQDNVYCGNSSLPSLSRLLTHQVRFPMELKYLTTSPNFAGTLTRCPGSGSKARILLIYLCLS